MELHQGGSANNSGTASPVAATFKWSRDNASVITAVTAISPATNVANNPTSQLSVQSTGRDNVLSFKPGDWIEITDDFLELNGRAGELHQIDSNGVSKALKTIRLQTPVSSDFQTRLNSGIDYHTRICRGIKAARSIRATASPYGPISTRPVAPGRFRSRRRALHSSSKMA